jgi:hypothetical protein
MGARARCPAGHGGHGREPALRDDAEAPAVDAGVDGVARARPRVPAHRAGGASSLERAPPAVPNFSTDAGARLPAELVEEIVRCAVAEDGAPAGTQST